jgi:hypothetical protein
MKTLKVGGLVLLVVVFLNIVPVQTYNPLAHIYVAGRTSLFTWPKADLYYGAIAPDIAWYAVDPRNPLDPTLSFNLGLLTHYTLFDLRQYATNPRQRAFARGFLTHNQIWGLDAYAHGEHGQYVFNKRDLLIVWAGGPQYLNSAMAEFAIETAVDLLLKQQQPLLPVALLEAVLCRSWDDQELLGKRYSPNDWYALYTTEPAFRNLTANYSLALALRSPQDLDALAALGVEVAKQITPPGQTAPDKKQVLAILVQAVSLCRADFMDPLKVAILEIRAQIGWF